MDFNPTNGSDFLLDVNEIFGTPSLGGLIGDVNPKTQQQTAMYWLIRFIQIIHKLPDIFIYKDIQIRALSPEMVAISDTVSTSHLLAAL